MSPTHRRDNRSWELQKYALLSDYLVKNWDANVIWLWGPGEEEVVDRAMGLTKEKSYKAPKTGFREMAALVGQSDFFVANSNGPSHVAVSCNTPSLQLHGPTNEISWCPLDENHRAVSGGQYPSTMKYISVDAVIKAAEKMKSIVFMSKDKRSSKDFYVNYKEAIERF